MTTVGPVVVCGSGLSGFAAAVTCLEAGVPVTLVEKAPETGGTTVLSGGLIWTFADYEKIREEIPDGNPILQYLVHDEVAEGRAWLEGIGAKLGPEETLLGHGWGRIMDPPQAINVLHRRFAELGGELLLETPMTSLLQENGTVTGIRVLRDGRPVDMPASAAILATGGFQGNPELVSRYIVPEAANLLLRANRWSTGDGLLAAQGVDAAVTSGLNNFYGHALTATPARYGKLEFRDVSQYYGQAAVAVNLDGERFADESAGLGEEILNQQLARQPKGRGYYIIDSSILRSYPIEGLEVVTKAMIDRARAAGADMVEAGSIEDLCSRLGEKGLPPKRLLQSLRGFNEAVTAGDGVNLKPPRRRLQTPLAEPPFYAVAVQAAITFTMGGIAIDEEARVLRRQGSSALQAPLPESRGLTEREGESLVIGTDHREMTIPGLYAAGCDAGNISHFGYMGGLATGLTTGRVAGRSAAAHSRQVAARS